MHFIMFIHLLLLPFLICKVTSGSGATIPKEIDPIGYLYNFGWLHQSDADDFNYFTLTSPPVTQALQDFQEFANLNPTGILDPPTLRVMSLPRCGESDTGALVDPDVEEVPILLGGKSRRKPRRKRRYVLQGSRWKTRQLHYNISKYTEDLSRDEVDYIIALAFSQWEAVANISFHHVRHPWAHVHIDIRFEQGNHGDEEVFDGPGGTTAHAYFPVWGGAVHFDDDEIWTMSSDQGVNLFQVATHEIGHALGLEHSNIVESVMHPFYRTYHQDFHLFEDDILGIQHLYGKRVLTFCDEAKVDAATTMVDGNTYLFSGSRVYVLTPFGVLGVPTSISVLFPGLPESNLDAAFTRPNGVSYFFKGSQFWRVSNMGVETASGFPKNVEEFFPGVPTPIDAAFVFSRDADNVIYFFKGSRYYKFDHREGTSAPRPLRDWPGIPKDGVDAVVKLQDEMGTNVTYFFRDNWFWKLNDKSYSIFLSDPPYPKSVSKHIFGCRW